jgi:hypothetical protein
MAYQDLTPEEQELLSEAERWLRGTVASLYRMLDDGDFPLKGAYWTQNITPILAQLQPSDPIPNTSGLAGAVDVTNSELTTAFNWLNSINTDAETNIQTLR